MVNTDEYFGMRAGTVWQALCEEGPMTAAQLKRKTKLNDKELFSGVSWLACERKVNVEGETPSEFVISLRE
ncbi:winged helix-turn-helix domain-containing protein [Candidatus Micrarchaeota archaeon]|nr:winged helix-turn-helix domain-containing protein [Candidatus Micrarchaeota archaeon]